MKNILKKTLFLITVVTLILSTCISSFAGNVTFNGSSQKFVFAPGSDESPTDLFENFKNVMPGDSITQKIEIKNDPAKNVKVKLYMKALDTSKAEGSNEDFLSQLKLTVKQNGETNLYEAPANEEAQLKDWVYLGTVFSGGTVNLDVTLEVPVEMGNEFKDAAGYVDWSFKVEELPVESTDPKPPQTGDNTQIIKYVVIMAASAVVITVAAISVFKKKKVSE